MSLHVCILDLADRRIGQGLYDFCAPRRLVIEHGYETYTKSEVGEKLKIFAIFKDHEDYILFKLRYM